jgi:hypothetical protein
MAEQNDPVASTYGPWQSLRRVIIDVRNKFGGILLHNGSPVASESGITPEDLA